MSFGLAHLKKMKCPKVIGSPLPSEKNNVICVMDEQWSYYREKIWNKKNQRWLWYAWCETLIVLLAYEFGRRKDAVLEKHDLRNCPEIISVFL